MLIDEHSVKWAAGIIMAGLKMRLSRNDWVRATCRMVWNGCWNVRLTFNRPKVHITYVVLCLRRPPPFQIKIDITSLQRLSAGAKITDWLSRLLRHLSLAHCALSLSHTTAGSLYYFHYFNKMCYYTIIIQFKLLQLERKLFAKYASEYLSMILPIIGLVCKLYKRWYSEFLQLKYDLCSSVVLHFRMFYCYNL